MRSALGKTATVERLRQGEHIQAMPTGRGNTLYYFWQDQAPMLTVRSDTVSNLQRDGLIRRDTDNIWAMCFNLIPTEKFKAQYPTEEKVSA